ncbi:Inner membrane protein yrbG [Serratia fonticola]|uniref:Inner membrane protein yrbG n=1 Tax=Serratia fonticola TaxID=47917 RepID=A0A4U9W8X5_SERFO|nr:Inner membrane protein yrbG [Serratia fonticola]
MFLAIVLLIVGLFLLVYGADRLVYGAAVISRSLGVPPLIIGMTIVGIGHFVARIDRVGHRRPQWADQPGGG